MTSLKDKYIEADWPVSNKVRAVSTTRIDGFSGAPFARNNLSDYVGDDLTMVEQNRRVLAEELKLPTAPVWLQQIHSTKLVELPTSYKQLPFDGAFTSNVGVVCSVLTADCLPVLFVDEKESWVAAAHAGWRGLNDGILLNTVGRYPGQPSQLKAWLGPAISKRYYEVGGEVRQHFLKTNKQWAEFFIPIKDKFMLDLAGVARQQLESLGLQVFGDNYCTYGDKHRFYSYRRDGKTGRTASLIWLS
ncbi:MAG: peptidoglycan editing factor PgeF [Kangiellaceae bacterium]|jgi:YfiH family protein|nr:peptidoglycan editing factor PgeF [Kangiellaceae bacterium]